MELQELLITAARTLAVYGFMLVVIRLLGKREVGSFSAFDLLVALMLGEVVDEIIYGDVSFAQGAVAVLVIALAQYATGWLTYLNRSMDNLLEGKPSVVEGFVRELATERYGPARNYLGDELQAATGTERLRDLTRALEGRTGPIQDVRGEPGWRRGDRAEAVAVLKTKQGRTGTLKFDLSRRHGQWPISDLGDLERKG